MLNIHKSQSGHELFTALCIVGDSDLARIYEYLTHHVEVRTVKNESIVIVVSGNWETTLVYFGSNMNKLLAAPDKHITVWFSLVRILESPVFVSLPAKPKELTNPAIMMFGDFS